MKIYETLKTTVTNTGEVRGSYFKNVISFQPALVVYTRQHGQ